MFEWIKTFFTCSKKWSKQFIHSIDSEAHTISYMATVSIVWYHFGSMILCYLVTTTVQNRPDEIDIQMLLNGLRNQSRENWFVPGDYTNNLKIIKVSTRQVTMDISSLYWQTASQNCQQLLETVREQLEVK